MENDKVVSSKGFYSSDLLDRRVLVNGVIHYGLCWMIYDQSSCDQWWSNHQVDTDKCTLKTSGKKQSMSCLPWEGGAVYFWASSRHWRPFNLNFNWVHRSTFPYNMHRNKMYWIFYKRISDSMLNSEIDRSTESPIILSTWKILSRIYFFQKMTFKKSNITLLKLTFFYINLLQLT